MATNCRVWVKVDPKDMGETKTPQLEVLPLRLEQNNYPCGSYKIPKGEGPLYLGVYVHYDGYDRGGVGDTLRRYFTDYEQVLNLILLGSLSYVFYSENAPDACNGICAYHNWRNEKTQIARCEPYNREYFIKTLEMSDFPYEYIYEDGQWAVVC